MCIILRSLVELNNVFPAVCPFVLTASYSFFVSRLISLSLYILIKDRQVAHLIPRFLDLYGQTGKQRDMAKLTLIVMLIKNMYAITK